MPAPKGNQFWKVRTKHGRDRIYADPQVLLEACIEYFDWAEENPLSDYRLAATSEGPIVMGVPKMRVLTISGLVIFLGIDVYTWDEMRKREGFTQVTQFVETVIHHHKYAGAAVNLFNANLIARDLGLVDRQELSGPGGGAVQVVTKAMSPIEAAEAWLETVRSVSSQAVPTAIEDQRDDKDGGE